ncbi:hypothetical protein MD484_g1295, partial [Candolleomyces efflorescens]
MDSSFTFPPYQPPAPRTRTAPPSSGPRKSNALRASVLDAALQLGLTNDSLVAEWMFSNTVQEEDEEEALQSPGLTHSSSAASDDYSSSSTKVPTTPPNSNALPPSFGAPVASWNPTKYTNDAVDMPYLRNDPATFMPSGNQVAFPTSQDIPIPPRPVTPNSLKKLKKKKTDEYESDGGYLSEGVKKKKGFGDLMKKDKAQLKEEKRQLKELKEEERKRKKSLNAASKKQKQEEGGYETDSSPILKSPFKSKSKKAKSKTPSADAAAGYDTDGGYQSAGSNLKKNKSRFFGLGSKSSRADLPEPVPAMPEPPSEPPMPLPIAQKFATSLPTFTPSPALDLAIQTDVGEPFITPISSAATTSRSPEEPSSAKQSTPTKDYLKLDIEPATMASSAAAHVQDRSSLSSAETSSSMSSNSRRRGFQFSSPARDDSSISTGHATGESVSTVGSSFQVHPIVPASQPFQPPSFTPVTYSPPGSSSGPNSAGALKPPSISLPLTRSVSPMMIPVSPLQINKSPRVGPSTRPDIDSRGPSPLPPLSPSSPSTTTSPSNLGIQSPDASSRPSTPRRPLNPPVEGFGPRLASPPALHPTGRLSPNPARGRLISPLLLPQNAKGDRSPSPLPSPNVLAYYDLPPPSPPPQGPLPSVPSGAPPYPPPPPPASQSQGSQLRNRMLMLDRERERELQNESLHPHQQQQYIQRGRESPFPKRPLVVPPAPGPTLPSSPRPPGLHRQQTSGGSAKGLGRSVRFDEHAYAYSAYSSGSGESSPEYGYTGLPAPRERGVPSTPGPYQAAYPSAGSPPRSRGTTPQPAWNDESRVSVASGEGLAYDAPAREEEDVGENGRGRFAVTPQVQVQPGLKYGRDQDADDDDAITQESFHSSSSDQHNLVAPPARPRPRRRSFDGGDVVARETLYQWEDDLSKNRESRWSGSIYSRVSIMDPDQSEEARERFVKRVQAMMGNGEPQEEVIPPVPRIPEGLANANSLNKF